MKIKFLNFPKIFFFIVSLLTFIQLSSASFKGELKLNEDKIREYAITFKVFEKEFIFTNSIEDYYRSFKRLIDKYNIGIPEEVLQEILLPLTQTEKDFVKITASNLANEANKFSYYRDNDYYQKLTETILKVRKLNLSAAIEIAIVDEYNKVAAIKTPYSNKQSNNIRYLYLLNQARYELVSAILYDMNKIN